MRIVVKDPWVRNSKGRVLRKKTEEELNGVKPHQTNVPTRMATESLDMGMIDNIIDDQIRKEARIALGDSVNDDTIEAIVDASMEEITGGDPRFYRDTLNALSEMNKRLVKAGVLIEHLGGGTGGLHTLSPVVGRLEGNVPGPYMMRGKRGQNVRLHIADEDAGNGVTGLVPYMDPSNPRQPLKTTFGDVRGTAAAYYDNPSEYVGAQALKLMGMRAGIGNQPQWHRSDLVDNATGTRIDVERGNIQLDTSTLPLQMTAVLKPKKGTMGSSLNEGAEALRKHTNNSNAASLIDAINTIRGSAYADNIADRHYYGKGFKTSDRGYNSDDRMDKIISLEYEPGAQQRDRQGFSVAPNEIHMVNIPETMAFIDQQGRNFSTTDKNSPVFVQSIEYVTGAGGQGSKRSKVKANVPKGAIVQQNDASRGVSAGSPINYNVSDSNPLTQQLLKVLPYL